MTRSAFAVLAIFLLSSCGSDPTPKPAETSQTITSPIPKPSTSEIQPLLMKLYDVLPGLSTDPEKAVDAARSTCESVLGGGRRTQWATQQRFSAGFTTIDDVTTEQADQIIAIVKEEPWCK